jgi:hypothetical protein
LNFKNRFMKKILFVILVAFAFTACETIVDIEIPSEGSRIVIESEIYNTKDIWKVKLSVNQPYFDQDSVDYISTASVFITELGGDTVFLNYTDTGLYVSADSHQCVVGGSYELSVAYNGQVYRAIEELQNAFPIDELLSFFLPPNDRLFPTGNYVFVQGQSDATKKNYYLFKTYRNDTLKSTDLDDDGFGSVSLLNSFFDVNDILGEIERGSLPRPILFDVSTGDTIVVEQFAITEEYYKFRLDLSAQQGRSGTPFDPPPANPNNNISNGGLGYFSVAHKERAELVVE